MNGNLRPLKTRARLPAKPIVTGRGGLPNNPVASIINISPVGTKEKPCSSEEEPKKLTDQDTRNSSSLLALKPWEECVISAYIENGGNRTAAYRLGKPISQKWKVKTVNSKASEFFASGKVQGRLKFLHRKVSEKELVSLEEITREHIEVYRRCMQHTPVLRNGEQVSIETANGEIAAAYKFQPMAALKALDQLAKHIGWYSQDNSQRKQVSQSIQIEFVEPGIHTEG
jgi:hypothetical protein